LIVEKITGNKKNIVWKRNRLMEDQMIDIHSISDLIPMKEMAGTYLLIVKYDRRLTPQDRINAEKKLKKFKVKGR